MTLPLDRVFSICFSRSSLHSALGPWHPAGYSSDKRSEGGKRICLQPSAHCCWLAGSSKRASLRQLSPCSHSLPVPNFSPASCRPGSGYSSRHCSTLIFWVFLNIFVIFPLLHFLNYPVWLLYFSCQDPDWHPEIYPRSTLTVSCLGSLYRPVLKIYLPETWPNHFTQKLPSLHNKIWLFLVLDIYDLAPNNSLLTLYDSAAYAYFLHISSPFLFFILAFYKLKNRYQKDKNYMQERRSNNCIFVATIEKFSLTKVNL